MDEEFADLPSDLGYDADSEDYSWGTDTDMMEAYGGDGGPDPSDYGAEWDTGEPIDEAEGLTQEQLGQGIVQETLGQQIVQQASADFASGGSGASYLGSFLNFGRDLLSPSSASAAMLARPLQQYASGLLSNTGGGAMAQTALAGVGGVAVRGARSVGAFVLKNLRTRFPGLSISRIRSSVRTFGPVAVASVLGLSVEGLMQMLMTVKPRRLNALNPKALNRSCRRLMAFKKKSNKINSMLAHLAGGRHGGYRRPSFPFRRKKKCA
jgi:hypothetical protein